MIKFLKINDIALISRLEVELGPGLTLLTGETGAGKSILVDALGLLLGARASSELVRTGEARASVEAVVDIGPEALGALEQHGLPAEGNEIVVRREVLAGGRGRASLNGALVPVGVLRSFAAFVGAIHGQHEPQGLLDPETHLSLLDAHAGLDDDVARLAEPFRRLRDAEAQLRALRRDRGEVERRRDMLEFQLAEIDKTAPRSGEIEALRQERLMLANAGRLAELTAGAYAALYDDEASAVDRLSEVYRGVEELASIDPRFAPFVEAGTAVRAQLEDLALQLRDYGAGLEAQPARLDDVESRLERLERLARKYGGSLEAVRAHAERCRADLETLTSPEQREDELQRQIHAATTAFREAGLRLSRRRRAAGRKLEGDMERELATLAMPRTRFRVSFDPEDVAADDDQSERWTERGLERAELLLSPNPGEDLRPLARIASGGELSRILLALKSVARSQDAGLTLVFDEIDAGIGGAVAEAVGRRLKALSRQHQVLCVTHLPQIAAMADSHLAVSKRQQGGRTLTELRRLEGEARVEELARMLGGESVGESARLHARELIKNAS